LPVKKKRFDVKSKINTKIRKNDTVYVIAGKEKGRTGKVIKVLRHENKVLVEKINIIKRHTKSSQENPSGGIIEKEAPIHISNVMLYDSAENKPTRVGYKLLETGEKQRISKRTGEVV